MNSCLSHKCIHTAMEADEHLLSTFSASGVRVVWVSENLFALRNKWIKAASQQTALCMVQQEHGNNADQQTSDL